MSAGGLRLKTGSEQVPYSDQQQFNSDSLTRPSLLHCLALEVIGPCI